ncbi:hypothetical protein K504DRAFT_192740 [Pleomassaria siparia CBS 279.74]|uniref:Uncharacterized protein n=1 Tax=Pleomassaria siparia CBS 279.74 TaxID=1314801 RepID=A0A6G1KGI5_9PLEO|nr:hypothetical protein K504DRAFT_192740 [Pleomassaria siparia CBS 279.74]
MSRALSQPDQAGHHGYDATRGVEKEKKRRRRKTSLDHRSQMTDDTITVAAVAMGRLCSFDSEGGGKGLETVGTSAVDDTQRGPCAYCLPINYLSCPTCPTCPWCPIVLQYLQATIRRLVICEPTSQPANQLISRPTLPEAPRIHPFTTSHKIRPCSIRPRHVPDCRPRCLHMLTWDI